LIANAATDRGASMFNEPMPESRSKTFNEPL